MSNSKKIVKLIIVTILITMVCVFGFRGLANSINLVFRNNFYIPEDSNVFSFKEIESGDGSGQGWLYGEDFFNYYASDNEREGATSGYLLFRKKDLHNCPGFDKTKLNTWCYWTPIDVE